MKTYDYRKPADIERESMRIIQQELAESGRQISPEHLPVIRRVIHTTADFDYAENLHFTQQAVSRSIQLLQQGGQHIITDTNMALAGISKPALRRLQGQAHCYMAQPEIAQKAKALGTTRAYISMGEAAGEYPAGIFACGNAPTALIALSELIREGLRPGLIIAVPVGFVNVEESKQEIFALCRDHDIPAIVALGRKGGSSVAAAICNALLYQAAGTTDPGKRP